MLILTWLGSFQGYSDLKQLLRKMSRSTRTLLMKNFNSIYQIVVFIFLLWSKGDHSQSVFGVFLFVSAWSKGGSSISYYMHRMFIIELKFRRKSIGK